MLTYTSARHLTAHQIVLLLATTGCTACEDYDLATYRLHLLRKRHAINLVLQKLISPLNPVPLQDVVFLDWVSTKAFR